MKQLSIFTLALLSSAFTLTPAVAQELVTATVATADLDLASDAGRKALERRVARAVVEVCGVVSPADLEGQNAVRACRVQTRALAEAEQGRLIAKAAKGSTIVIAAAR